MIKPLNGLRFIATTLIFLSHTHYFRYSENISINETYSYFSGFGHLGTMFFFILSGYVMTIANRDKYKVLTSDKKQYRGFLVKRLSKLYPLYFIMMIISIPITMWAYFEQAPLLNLGKLVICSLFLQTSIPPVSFMGAGLSTAFNSAGWFIVTLFWLYAITPWLIKFAVKKTNLFCIIVMAGYILTVFFGEIINGEFYHWYYYFSPFGRIWEYCIGIGSAVIFLNYKDRLSRSNVSMISNAMVIVFLISILAHPYYNAKIFFPLLTSVLFIALSFQSGFMTRFFSTEKWTVLGKMSYSFYMTHYLILIGALKIINLYPFLYEEQNAVYLILITIVCFIINLLISYIIYITNFEQYLSSKFNAIFSKADDAGKVNRKFRIIFLNKKKVV